MIRLIGLRGTGPRRSTLHYLGATSEEASDNTTVPNCLLQRGCKSAVWLWTLDQKGPRSYTFTLAASGENPHLVSLRISHPGGSRLPRKTARSLVTNPPRVSAGDLLVAWVETTEGVGEGAGGPLRRCCATGRRPGLPTGLLSWQSRICRKTPLNSLAVGAWDDACADQATNCNGNTSVSMTSHSGLVNWERFPSVHQIFQERCQSYLDMNAVCSWHFLPPSRKQNTI